MYMNIHKKPRQQAVVFVFSGKTVFTKSSYLQDLPLDYFQATEINGMSFQN